MKATPTQIEIDRVAAFVEAAPELKIEPFYGKDENRTVSWQGSFFVYQLGDRFHFRSALVTFRRIWMTKEPSHFYSAYGALARYVEDSEKRLLSSWRDSVQKIENDSTHLFKQVGSASLEVKNKELIDLWLNAVFAHVSLGNKNKRLQFEKLQREHGHGPLENGFRHAVWQLGLQYMNMSNIHAERFFDFLARSGPNPFIFYRCSIWGQAKRGNSGRPYNSS